jgi:hypothetical protein
MTEPSPSRPAPGPPRPGPRHGGSPPSSGLPVQPPAESTGRPEDRFADLADRPVAEHVAVFDAEHTRLERELGTIDQL